MALGFVAVAGYMMFGTFGEKGGPLGTGVARISAQPTGSQEARTGRLTPSSIGPAAESATPFEPTAAQRARSEAQMEMAERGMEMRREAMENSGTLSPVANVQPDPASQTTARVLSAPSTNAPGTFTIFRNTQLAPAAGGLGSSSVNEPAVAQNGKDVFQTWNWGAARSGNGGATWGYINPYSSMLGPTGSSDFCCDQDVIYDKGTDKMFWLRQGLSGTWPCGAGCTEGRDLLTVDNGVNNICTYDLRPSFFGLGANTWFDYPRLSTSDSFLYMHSNVFNTAGNFITHFIARFPLAEVSACATTFPNSWAFTDGWTGALVENAKEIMYFGDTIGNATFRISWFFDDSTTRNFVDRAIPAFTIAGSVCTVPGGANPCARTDQRITGGVVLHNTPTPQGLGIAGDKVDFFWNVAQGGGFAMPYVESAGFQGNTINYVQRKFIWNGSVAFMYAAAGANDRQHEGISLMQFNPVASGANPYHLVGIDDDINGSAPGWEIAVANVSTSVWSANNAGDYYRTRSHNPVGVAWAATGVFRDAAGAYRPTYTVFGRERDLPAFNRFDQK